MSELSLVQTLSPIRHRIADGGEERCRDCGMLFEGWGNGTELFETLSPEKWSVTRTKSSHPAGLELPIGAVPCGVAYRDMLERIDAFLRKGDEMGNHRVGDGVDEEGLIFQSRQFQKEIVEPLNLLSRRWHSP